MKAEERERIIDNLPKEYFREDADPIRGLLERLPEVLTDQYFQHTETELTFELDIISQQLSEKVSKNYSSFVSGMTQIHNIGKEVETTTELCTSGRHYLLDLDEHLVKGSMSVLTKKRKQDSLRKLRETLMAVKMHSERNKHARELILEGDYPAALQLLLHDVKTGNSIPFHRFSCLRGYDSTSKENYQFAEKKVDESLRQCCRSYDVLSFQRVLAAYRMMGKGTSLFDKISTNVLDTVNDVSREIVYGYVFGPASAQGKIDQVKTMAFDQLCEFVEQESIVACLANILAILMEVMCNFNGMISFLGDKRPMPFGADGEFIDKEKHFGELRGGLAKQRVYVWDSIQRRVAAFLSITNYHGFKMDRFLVLFYATQLFICVGESFSQREAHNLRGSLRLQSKLFFDEFHREVLEVLRLMLENETWVRLLTGGFSLNGLREFRGEGISDTWFLNEKEFRHMCAAAVAYLDGDETSENPFRKLCGPSSTSPQLSRRRNGKGIGNGLSMEDDMEAEGDEGEKGKEEGEGEEGEEEGFDGGGRAGGGNSSDEDMERELQESYITQIDEYESRGPETKQIQFDKLHGGDDESDTELETLEEEGDMTNGPVLTSAGLNIVKNIGKYLQIMGILTPVSYEVFSGITDLFMYCIYMTFALFGDVDRGSSDPAPYAPELDRSLDRHLSSSFARVKERLHDIKPDLVLDARRMMGYGMLRGGMSGLTEKVVAMESNEFVLNVIRESVPDILRLVPKVHHTQVESTMENMKSLIDETRRVVYERHFGRILRTDHYIQLIGNTKWDTREISQHYSGYVAVIHRDLVDLSARITQSDVASASTEAPQALWEVITFIVMRTLLEGFSRVKKCSMEGRAQMSLDLKTLQSEMEDLTHQRPLPHVSLVDTYIKSFYLPESDILSFCRDHPEYSVPQLVSLVNTGVGQHMKRKNRLELIAAIESIEKDRHARTARSGHH
eukprot:TRINITY_DN12340_c0_g1_i1.p1 TRINITY_DN12340_c0_g1~~TRINITY_DN12340_c0_g1_i1.p1  ORF type:complete len:1033 (+),score=247.66 TRINITY_DN12340_c0_g1_i1:222-3101(+)